MKGAVTAVMMRRIPSFMIYICDLCHLITVSDRDTYWIMCRRCGNNNLRLLCTSDIKPDVGLMKCCGSCQNRFVCITARPYIWDSRPVYKNGRPRYKNHTSK
jgi:hypothetical protein